MKFELLDKLVEEERAHKEELERMKKRYPEALEKLNLLENQYKQMVKEGQDTEALDKQLDEIDRQKVIVDRRKNEKGMLAGFEGDTQYDSATIANEFTRYTKQYKEEKVDHLVKQLEETKAAYLELIGELQQVAAEHETQKRAVQRHLDKRIKIGVPQRMASILSIPDSYKNKCKIVRHI